MDKLTGENFRQLIWTSFIVQFVPVEKRRGDRVKWMDRGYRYFSNCENHFIRIHENLVQHPSNSISIIIIPFLITLSRPNQLVACISGRMEGMGKYSDFRIR